LRHVRQKRLKETHPRWIRVFRNAKPAPGTNGPLIPGDPEREAEAIRSKEGIPLIKPVVNDLLDILPEGLTRSEAFAPGSHPVLFSIAGGPER
jgi:LDH2 family malate/lactate/ureidoglycolate dehydrogenase